MGFDTSGLDSSAKAIDRAEKIAEIEQAVDFGSEDFDVFIIGISTHERPYLYIIVSTFK